MAHSPESDDARIGDPVVIINADDWGRDKEVTDRTLDCLLQGVVSSASAMVFMEDSERAAELAHQHGVDAGLHLNLTTAFSGLGCNAQLKEQQQKVTRFLRASRLCPAIYHPGLASSFEYVVRAQIDEYQRLYGRPPSRVDGHHHMHLCANVQVQKLLPAGTIARRNFSFAPGEKGAVNRFYRRWQDRRLAKRHRMTDYFYSLPPMDPPGRLERIFGLASRASVEVETHPVNSDEYQFLTGGELMRRAEATKIAREYSV
jgi:chitin disaccharide deacetylase